MLDGGDLRGKRGRARNVPYVGMPSKEYVSIVCGYYSAEKPSLGACGLHVCLPFLTIFFILLVLM